MWHEEGPNAAAVIARQFISNWLQFPIQKLETKFHFFDPTTRMRFRLECKWMALAFIVDTAREIENQRNRKFVNDFDSAQVIGCRNQLHDFEDCL